MRAYVCACLRAYACVRGACVRACMQHVYQLSAFGELTHKCSAHDYIIISSDYHKTS